MTFFNDLVEFPFLQHALIAALLSAVIAGVMGTFVVIRRSTYVVGAISHSALGGIGLARYLQVAHGWEWANPMLGAMLFALMASGSVSLVRAGAAEREDTLLSALWALGMALGISFLAMTPGYGQDVMGYLFGDILLISSEELLTIGILTALVLLFLGCYFDRLVASSFNTQLAALRGVPVFRLETLFHLATALTVVILVRLVGIVLVIALLTLPAATASRLCRSLPSTVIVAVALSTGSLFAGLWISYEFNLPTGATIIECAALLYILSLFRKKS